MKKNQAFVPGQHLTVDGHGNEAIVLEVTTKRVVLKQRYGPKITFGSKKEVLDSGWRPFTEDEIKKINKENRIGFWMLVVAAAVILAAAVLFGTIR